MYAGPALFSVDEGEILLESTGRFSFEALEVCYLSILAGRSLAGVAELFAFPVPVLNERCSSFPSMVRLRWLDVGRTLTLAPDFVCTRISSVWSSCVTLTP